MATESELTNTFHFDDIVDDFAQSRAKKKCAAYAKTILWGEWSRWTLPGLNFVHSLVQYNQTSQPS